jgi:hypothetical protein
MKQIFIKYGAAFLLFCALLNCEKYKNEGSNPSVPPDIAPEVFVRQYQKWLDVNDFEKAAENATDEEKIRLEDLKKFVFKTQETLDSSLLHTTILAINCLPKNELTICACKMKDQFEVYDITFYLKKLNNRWLMDAPAEEAQIYQDEELQKIIDSIFLTMENKFQQ